MDIFHTIIIKIASTVSAVFLLVGIGAQTPKVTVVDVQDNHVVITESTTTIQKAPTKPSVAVIPISPIVTVTNSVVETTTTTPPVVPESAPQTVQVPVYIIQAVSAPQMATGGQEPSLITNQAPVMQPQILIKSPLPGKGKLDRKYEARSTPQDELNEIYLGAVLVKADGSIENEEDMVITATDETQNVTKNGTGNMSTFGDPDNPKYYYPFRYEFRTVGQHTITFTALGVSESVTINVEKEDTR